MGAKSSGKHHYHHPPYYFTSHPHSRLAWCGGGTVTPQHPSPPPAAWMQSETEPLWLGFGFFEPNTLPASGFANTRPHHHNHLVCTTTPPLPHPYVPSSVAVSHGAPETEPQRLGFIYFAQTPSPPRISRRHHPTTTTTSYAPPCHPYTPSTIAVLHGASKSSHDGLVSAFGPNPLHASRCVNTPPHHHHNIICTTTPPLHTICHHHFTRRTLYQVATARFRFSAQTPPLALCSMSAQPHHRHHFICTTTPPLRTIPFAVSHGAPEIEPRRLGFGLLAQTPLSRLAFAKATPHHHHPLIHTLAPPPLPAIYPHFQRRTWNRALVARFWILGPQPPLPPHICECNTPLPLPPCQHHCTTSLRRSPPHFRWRTRNWAPVAWFQVLGP